MNKKQKQNVKVLSGVFAVAAGMVIASAMHASPAYASFAADQNGKFFSDFATFAEEKVYAGDLNATIFAESVVLLKNKDNALPLAQGSTVNLMGIRSYRPILGGTGSGGVGSQYEDLPTSLRNAGFQLNGMMEPFYNSHLYQALITQGMGNPSNAPYDGPISDFGNDIINSFTLYEDVALITIGRLGGEGADLFRRNLPTLVNADPTAHVLQLFDNEKALIELAKEHCDKVVIMLNTANVMEIPELEDDPDIDAILWIGEPGTTGFRHLGKLLNGEINPSGRTADIWPANFKKDPTWFNSFDNSQNNVYDPVAGTWSNDYSNTITRAEDSTVNNSNKYAIEEEENIYVGYKWYETAAADGKLDQLAIYESEKGTIPEDKAGDKYYNRSTGVVYPFGFGLSYTAFEQELVSSAADVNAQLNAISSMDDVITVKAQVKNVGNVAGKQVVQLYNHAPYTAGEIEKAEISLAGFAKTKLLKPGQSEIVNIDVKVRDLASFDYNDANHNNFSGWELEGGDYELRLQVNSHDVVDTLPITFGAKQFDLKGKLAAAALGESDNYNWLSQGDDYDSLLPIKEHTEADGVTFKNMTRADLVGTFPTSPKAAERVYPDRVLALVTNASNRAGSTQAEGEGTEFNKYYRYTSYYSSADDLPTDPWYKTNADIPESWTQLAEARASGTQADVLIQQMRGLDYNSEEIVPEGHPYAGMTEKAAWDAFMNQLTYAELAALMVNGGYRTPGLNAIGKKQANDNDGPAALNARNTSGFFTSGYYRGDGTTNLANGTSWTCEVNISSSWDVKLANKQGLCVGNESLFMGATGWYGPAMNTHRSPFGGRNFEYYSQDGVHGGKIAAAVVGGAQSKGCNVFMKHYVLNDQETNRMQGVATYTSEQAMREIYLKPFEYSVKEGHATAMMSAFNRVASIPGFINYRTNVSILCDEWGFMGETVTDYYSASLGKANLLQRGGSHMALNTNLNYNANNTGTNFNANTIVGQWDASLRDGKGGVRDGMAVTTGEGDEAVTTIPESPTQYYWIRMCAMKICWVGANSNAIQNGVTTVGATGNTTTAANIFQFESTQNVSYGQALNIDIKLNPEHVPADCNVAYSVEGTLPAGLSVNSASGTISGSPTEVGTFNVTVQAIVDNWIMRTASLRLVVSPTLSVAAGDQISIPLAGVGFQVGDNFYYNGTPYAITSVNAGYTLRNAPAGLSIVTVSEEEATEEKPAGLYLEGTLDEVGQYTPQLRQTVHYTRSGRDRTGNVDTTLLIVVTGDPTPQPEVHGGIVSSVINDEGHLVITYEDGYIADLGLVVGADGAQGPQGEKGDKGDTGETGAQGPQGEKGETGAAGAQGPQGEKGDKGDTGAQGPAGPAGADGKDGVDGKDGANGQDAKGCGGSIAAASGIMALIAGLGLAAISIKRKRD